ncbi:MAG: hypothetical protein EZS28_031070 [Streblomastix strix]|uniref:Uncharacterized protein n=1 Tax=Streblomastix strix TaxID=222440 RepID=A0A5J4USR5_9EUKA|nr:MAG: hypothetical protein EZS28_031070 [Streblomastix strix]
MAQYQPPQPQKRPQTSNGDGKQQNYPSKAIGKKKKKQSSNIINSGNNTIKSFPAGKNHDADINSYESKKKRNQIEEQNRLEAIKKKVPIVKRGEAQNRIKMLHDQVIKYNIQRKREEMIQGCGWPREDRRGGQKKEERKTNSQ